MRIGVLALQGDFREHLAAFKKLGIEGREVRTVEDLRQADGLIIPGGESTTIANLLEKSGLFSEIKKRGQNSLPIYGTCAGAILLAREITNHTRSYLGLIDIAVRRNAYGRQIESFEADLNIKNIGAFHAVFIRAPIIERVGPKVEVLALHDSVPVMVQQKNILVSSFHPELTGDLRIHQYFVNMIERRRDDGESRH